MPEITVKEIGEKIDSFKQAQEEEGKLFHQLKDQVVKLDDEVKKYGSADATLVKNVEELSERMDNQATAFKEFSLSQGTPESEAKEAAKELVEVKSEFVEIMRVGNKEKDYAEYNAKVRDLEKKAGLFVGDDRRGGVFVHAEISLDVIRKETEIDPLRQLADVRTTTANEIKLPQENELMEAFWSGEKGPVQDSNNKYGELNIPIHDLDVIVPISTRLLQDASINIQQETVNRAGVRFAQKENAAFTVGVGNDRPQGFTQDTIVAAAALTTQTSLVIEAEDIIEMYYNGKTFYTAGAVFGFQRSYIKNIRKLRSDSGAGPGTGEFLWQPGLNGMQQGTLLGSPLWEFPSLATDETPTVGDVVGTYSNFGLGYRIYDRLDMDMLIDPFSAKRTKFVEYMFTKRVGGAVVLPEAFTNIKLKA